MKKPYPLIFHFLALSFLGIGLLSCGTAPILQTLKPTPKLTLKPTPTQAPFPWAGQSKWEVRGTPFYLTLVLNASGSLITDLLVGIPGELVVRCGDYLITNVEPQDVSGQWPISSTGAFIISEVDAFPGASTLAVQGTFQKDGKVADGTWQMPSLCSGSWTADAPSYQA